MVRTQPFGKKFSRILLIHQEAGEIADFSGIDSHSVDWNLHLRRELRDVEMMELQQLIGFYLLLRWFPTSLLEKSGG